MKRYFALLSLLLVFASCEKPGDCISSSGATVTREVVIDMPTVNDSIKRIFVEHGIELIVSEGPVFKVTIETGENLIGDIEVRREGNVLYLKDHTTCNWVREFGETKVHVTTPKLEEIYSKTERDIRSEGVLTFPILRLFSLDTDGDNLEGAGTGDFYINVNNGQLVVEANNVSRFYISGQTQQALLNLYGGDGRIEAQNLTAQDVRVYHRGSNDMFVKPVQSLYARLYSTGNLMVSGAYPFGTPDVVSFYQGQVIYN